MSLGLHSAILVKLEADGEATVAQLAAYLAVDEGRVRHVLRDMLDQGLCALWSDQGEIISAEWCKPVEQHPCA